MGMLLFWLVLLLAMLAVPGILVFAVLMFIRRND
jgi:hypothetical protein